MRLLLLTRHGFNEMRKLLHPMDELAAVEFLLDKMKDTKTNGDFFDSMNT